MGNCWNCLQRRCWVDNNREASVWLSGRSKNFRTIQRIKYSMWDGSKITQISNEEVQWYKLVRQRGARNIDRNSVKRFSEKALCLRLTAKKLIPDLEIFNASRKNDQTRLNGSKKWWKNKSSRLFRSDISSFVIHGQPISITMLGTTSLVIYLKKLPQLEQFWFRSI